MVLLSHQLFQHVKPSFEETFHEKDTVFDEGFKSFGSVIFVFKGMYILFSKDAINCSKIKIVIIFQFQICLFNLSLHERILIKDIRNHIRRIFEESCDSEDYLLRIKLCHHGIK